MPRLCICVDAGMCCQDINYSLKLMGVYDSSLFIACGQRFDMISTVMEKTKKRLRNALRSASPLAHVVIFSWIDTAGNLLVISW